MSTSKQRNHEDEYDGEPGCQGLAEVNRMFRHHWDPTSFWQCEAQGHPAKRRPCPTSQLFSDKHGRCVHYTEWQWAEPTEPPSRPARDPAH